MAKAQPDNRAVIKSWVKAPRRWPKNETILISYLGNISGRDEQRENTTDYIQAALKQGYNASCEVLVQHGAFFLLTANGLQRLPYAMLSNPKMWFGALNAPTLDALCAASAHAFPCGAALALTTVGYLWCQPGVQLTPRSIAVLPEEAPADWLSAEEPAGLCSAVISRYV